MLIYWLLFAFFAVGAIVTQPALAPATGLPDGRVRPGVRVPFRALFALGAIVTIGLIGLRYKVGADWLADDGRTDFRRINEAKQHRWEKLARMLQYPPKWLLPPIKAVKAAVGRDSLGLAQAVTNLNRQVGYRHPIAPSLKAEIEAFYREDNRRLDRRLSSGELVA